MSDEFCAIVEWVDFPGAAGALSGRSFAVKDNYEVDGCIAGCGSPAWRDSHVSSTGHAPVVERLISSGARLKARTQMDELAFSLLGENIHYGTPINPASRDRVPCGSSSGSAVVVAAGLVNFALGSDTAGSVRAPSAACGVLGYRPTHGVISTVGIIPLAPSFDVIGWMARDPIVFSAVGQALLPPDNYKGSLDQCIVLEDAFEVLHPELQSDFETVLRQLEAAGVRLMRCKLGEMMRRHAFALFRDSRFGNATAYGLSV